MRLRLEHAGDTSFDKAPTHRISSRFKCSSACDLRALHRPSRTPETASQLKPSCARAVACTLDVIRVPAVSLIRESTTSASRRRFALSEGRPLTESRRGRHEPRADHRAGRRLMLLFLALRAFSPARNAPRNKASRSEPMQVQDASAPARPHHNGWDNVRFRWVDHSPTEGTSRRADACPPIRALARRAEPSLRAVVERLKRHHHRRICKLGGSRSANGPPAGTVSQHQASPSPSPGPRYASRTQANVLC